ncbi:hypothetical protein V8F20_006290 [Naviculisporaceae sp. PSN 640]
MVYDWDPYKEECYDLYINQKKTIVQIADYLKARYGFSPKPRTYIHKFKAWKFPPREIPKWKDEALVARVKELWARNLSVPQMLQVLNDEDGYDIEERTLQRLRSVHGLFLRSTGAAYGLTTATKRVERMKLINKRTGAADRQKSRETTGSSVENGEDDDDEDEEEDEEDSEEDQVDDREGEQEGEPDIVPTVEPLLVAPIQELTAEQEAAAEFRKQQRLMEMQAESMARWATKKRRRRTMPFAGLPADPPCPPRYPSETTLTESKSILGLDEEAYLTVRKLFQTICEQEGVIKKTVAGPDKWEACKDQLVRQSLHLRAAMWDQMDLDKKKLAIDVICCDVTKRMRVVSTQLSVPKSKTILNLNPEQGRQIRSALYLILAQEKFEGKHFEGKAHWREIKAKWYESSDLMRSLSVYEREDCPDPDRALKLRAVEFLARDATRRYREEAVKQGRNVLEEASKPQPPPVRKPRAPRRSRAKPPGGGTAPQSAAPKVSQPPKESAPGTTPKRRGRPPGSGKTQKAQPGAEPHTEARLAPLDMVMEDPDSIDPLVTTAAAAQSYISPEESHQPSFAGQQHRFRVTIPASTAPGPIYHPPPQTRQAQQHTFRITTPASTSQEQTYHPPSAQPQAQTQLQQPPASMAVFFKLHAGTALPSHIVGPSMWISTISQHPSVDDVRAAALAKYPGAICLAIEGIIKDGKGGELPLPVSGDMELQAYLEHVKANANVTGHSAAPTFVVQLMA